MSLLSRVDPIDDAAAVCNLDEATNTRTRSLVLTLVDLTTRGAYVLEWKRDGSIVDQWENRTTVEIAGAETGNYEASVEFLTSEIRLDPHGFTRSKATFAIDSPCTAT